MSRSPRTTGASAVPRTAPPTPAHFRHPARLGGTRPNGASKPLFNLLVIAAAAGSALLVAACSSSPTLSATAGAARPAAAHGVPGKVAFGAENGPAIPAAGGALGASPTTASQAGTNVAELVKLAPDQSIIYTGNLTLRVKDNDVDAAAAVAANEVTAVGGYVASEQDVSESGPGTIGQVDLQLKIPVAAYHQVFGELTALGKLLSRSRQAQDVTQEVADVSSRVASAQAAIKQLRQLLTRAGDVGQLLSVQDEINSQESALEALLAQQTALAHETTYATVYLTLLGHRVPVHKKHHHKKVRHGLTAGLATGWRGLKDVVVWLLTALGTALPFAVPVLVIAGIVYLGRRRVTRRRSPVAPPAAAPPAATS
jgi:hypothetical protein